MQIKNLLLIFYLSLWSLLVPSLALAQTTTPQASSPNQADKLAELHAKCDSAIAERTTSLNNNLNRINGLTKLSPADKSKFSGLINTNLTGLNTQKSKCDGDTDLKTLRTDYQNVFLNFRIYAVFLPQTNLLVASDTMGATADKLQDLYTKLQTRIQQVGNPSNLTSLLSDIQAKITDAKLQYNTVESLVTPLTPNSFNTDPSGTKTTLQNAITDIKAGAQDLKTAFQDAQKIRDGLKTAVPSSTP